MIIKGIQKTSLVDFPGRIALTVFLAGCNFRCPWCHNLELVFPEQYNKMPDIPLDEFKKTVIERENFIDGVCITGGEPTIHAENLMELMRWIKSEGLLVKLDTNGYRPDALRSFYRAGLVDFTAMDIKNRPGKYAATAGLQSMETGLIEESISLIRESSPEYQFRTTLAPGLVTKEDIDWIETKFRVKLVIQQYKKPEGTG